MCVCLGWNINNVFHCLDVDDRKSEKKTEAREGVKKKKNQRISFLNGTRVSRTWLGLKALAGCAEAPDTEQCMNSALTRTAACCDWAGEPFGSLVLLIPSALEYVKIMDYQ